jgi:hypothetical protein
MTPDTARILIEACAWLMIAFCAAAAVWEIASSRREIITLRLQAEPPEERPAPATAFRPAA